MSHYSNEAEQSVVGAILIDNTAIDRITCGLVSSDFAIEAHRMIYESALRLVMAGVPADPITVSEDLDQCNNLDLAGGLAYIGNLYSATPGAANVARYAEIVRNYSRERGMLVAISDAHSEIVASGNDSAKKIANAAELVLAAADSGKGGANVTHATDLARKVGAAIMARNEGGGEEGLSIGFADLERMAGKFKPGQLIIVAGRPGMGKSTLARNIAENVSKTKGVVFVSLEMDDEELAECFVSSLGHASFDAIKDGTLEGDHALDVGRGITALSNLKLATATNVSTVHEIQAIARTESRKLGGIAMIVVDYLQLMESSSGNDRREQVDAISRGLKKLAQSMKVPIIALSQLSRAVENRADKRPMLSDLRESGAIEQDADKVIFLYRDDYYSPDSFHKGMAEAIIAKNRRGKTGKVALAFIGDQSRFADLAPGYIIEQEQKQTRRRGGLS